MLRKFIVLVVLVALMVTLTTAQNDLTGTPEEICDTATPAPQPEAREFDTPEQVLEEGVNYRAIFCTEAGPVYIDLFEDITPVTVNNFVFLAQNNYYNNTTFHRVIADFMAQGGDPTATGSGGPGYQFQDEFVGYLTFDRTGLLAMANAGPGTNGSQFFITTSEPEHLNYRHTIFGEVLTGQENVENIRLRDPQTDPDPGTLLNTVVIITEPENVEADFEVPERATREDIAEVFDTLPDLAPGLSLPATTEIVDAETFVDGLSEDVATLLIGNNLEYVASVSHDNADCAVDQIPFTSIGYELFAFADTGDASNVIGDEVFLTLVGEGELQESEALSNGYYTTETTACDGDAIVARSYWQRGRYLAIATVTLPTNSGQIDQIDLWLDQVVGRQIYENLLSDVLRAEIWY